VSAPERVESDGAALSIWRDAASFEGRRTAALGAFSCEDAAEGARLLRECAERLTAEGFEAVVGPMDGDTWGAHRLVVESDGRAPFFLEPQNPTWHPVAFDAAGFEVIARYLSAEGCVGEKRPSLSRPGGLALRDFDPARSDEELRAIHALSLQAFAGNVLYRPIGAETFVEQYRPVLPLLDPELLLLAEDEAGRLQAFLFAVADHVQGSRPESVIIKTYASLRPGAGSWLVDALYARARAKGFSKVVHALMHESNVSARHSRRSAGRIFRGYALWGLRP
jgi:ribosomal protein S18 acetylase RimI-like enzyme